ncbi:HlyC/CorC family transporter [Ornithinimicrobium ciconiae]|uniref:HlyC/CorC family transporter n=1 Tax=Ornithinimicrobium ciconiae TaxID=2594265 RepID=A0A516GE91_9MICO|nr:hemolysin family protein [Ornithinimicrobium ciconiae]QDO89831.1 HlyC/CorC family transporter [Ornithinimicrobium ciconiae]
MSTGTALWVSVILLILNAFFVGAEFAVVAAKRHRLEERAAQGSRAAKSAVAASRELSLMLAGAQLGITLCTLGLGALAEPAVATLLEPLLQWAGLPGALTHVVAVIIAVALVVFLHMVVGEMAPKSWAISHPESSAILLALPFRAFTWVSRPLIWTLNTLANLILRVFGVQPLDTVSATHGPAELQMLLAQSHQHGVLPDEEHAMLTGALRLEQETIADVMFPVAHAICVPETGTATDVETMCRETGRSRVFVTRGERIVGLVHVRDAVRATATGATGYAVTSLVQEAITLPASLPLIDGVHRMRAERAQLALVADRVGTVVGLISLEDLLEQILGEFDDETDDPDPSPAPVPAPSAASR